MRTGASGFLFRHFSLCFLHKACVTSIHGIDYSFFLEFQLGVILSLLFILQWQNLQDFSYWQSGLGKSKFHIKLTSKYSVSHVSEFQYIESPNIFFYSGKESKFTLKLEGIEKVRPETMIGKKQTNKASFFSFLCVNKAMEWIIASVELKSAHVILCRNRSFCS